MGYLQLRLLFELLCDGLEEENAHIPLHFEGAYGLEMPHRVLMIFVFQEGVMMCQFEVQEDLDESEDAALRVFASEQLSANECLDMTESLRSFSGNFSELFA